MWGRACWTARKLLPEHKSCTLVQTDQLRHVAGWRAATVWGWELSPALGYVGQGMIMGPRTANSMLAGALAGWAVLGPIAKAKGEPDPLLELPSHRWRVSICSAYCVWWPAAHT